jgi:hypothetical protein
LDGVETQPFNDPRNQLDGCLIIPSYGEPMSIDRSQRSALVLELVMADVIEGLDDDCGLQASSHPLHGRTAGPVSLGRSSAGIQTHVSQQQSEGTRRPRVKHLSRLTPHQCADIAERPPILIPRRLGRSPRAFTPHALSELVSRPFETSGRRRAGRCPLRRSRLSFRRDDRLLLPHGRPPHPSPSPSLAAPAPAESGDAALPFLAAISGLMLCSALLDLNLDRHVLEGRTNHWLVHLELPPGPPVQTAIHPGSGCVHHLAPGVRRAIQPERPRRWDSVDD